MRIFGFDLLPYPEHLDHLKVDGELPYPQPAADSRAAPPGTVTKTVAIEA